MVSLRCLSITMNLSCVIIGSFVAAYFAISSGDNALTKTKDTGDMALEQCFNTASDSVIRQTTALIDALIDQSEQFLGSFMKLPLQLSKEYNDRLNALHPRYSFDWEWLWRELRPQLLSTMQSFRGQITGIGVSTAKGQLVWMYEADRTNYAPDDHFHQISTVGNNGSDYGDIDERSWTVDPSLDELGFRNPDLSNWDRPCQGADANGQAYAQPGAYPRRGFCFYDPEQNGGRGSSCGGPTVRDLGTDDSGLPCKCVPTCNKSLVKHGEAVPFDGVDADGCVIPKEIVTPVCKYLSFGPFTGQPFTFWLLGYLFAPLGTVVWSPPSQITTYVGLIAVGSWAHPAAARLPYSAHTAKWGGTAGIVWTGMDLRTVSSYLRNLGLAGLSRLFLVFATDPLGARLGRSGVGKLLAASHGSVSLGEPGKEQEFILPENSSDAVVRATTMHIYSRAERNGSAVLRTGYQVISDAVGAEKKTPSEFETELPAQYTADRQGQGPQHRLFLKVRQYEAPGGIAAWMIMTFDWYLIMGPIKEREQKTRETIIEANNQVDEDLKADRTLLYIIVAAVAVVMIVISVVFVIAIVRPLQLLGDEMEEVSRMKLENVTEQLSALSEVARCQIAFLLMVKALRKYRDYMPLSLLQDSDDEEEEGGSNGDEAKSQISGQSDSVGRAPSHPDKDSADDHRASARKSSARSSAVSKGTKQRSQRQKVTAAERTAKGINKKQATFVVLGASGFHVLLKDDLCVDKHTCMLQSVVEKVGQTKGVPDTFCGDRMLVSFNAVKAAGGHKLMAAKMAKDAVDALKASTCADIIVTFAAASGEVRCGNLGCPGMMRFTFFSKILSWAYAFQRYAQSVPVLPIHGRVFADGTLAEEVGSNYNLRAVALVQYAKKHEAPLLIHQVTSKKQVSEDEWMYQLEEGAKSNPWNDWNTAIDYFYQKKETDGFQQLEAFAADTPEILQGDPLLDWWLQRGSAGSHVETLLHH
eukprot:TRINITY_DN1433_c0_g1_i1.p1 TRINITY_DN1433_c0_g1~~TRINITY_DN1433_c0_g1_i1.p1  ORF type:complete len:1014 (+),score=211.34 TRINITY_DN1433_c0_g1_i1:100-3042(+)